MTITEIKKYKFILILKNKVQNSTLTIFKLYKYNALFQDIMKAFKVIYTLILLLTIYFNFK